MNAIIRARQRIMSAGIKILGVPEPTLITGKDSLLRVPDFVKNSGKNKVLIVTTAGFIKRGSLKGLLDEFEKKGIKVEVFSEVTPDPTIECVEKAREVYITKGCEAIIAVGGGSVMDCSKVCGARISNPDKSIRDMRGIFKVKEKLPDIYAVPTTAGTGSETTVAAVITDTIDGTHYKYAISDFKLVPKFAVLYPEITVSLPKHITATTGMDALTHAVEAYTNLYASGRIKEKALSAVEAIFENLFVAYENGDDIEARDKLIKASFDAGVAFTNNYVGYVHAVAHAIGGLYGVAHGLANAIILPYVMEQFGDAAHKSLAELATRVGIDGENDCEKATGFISRIREMNTNMDIPNYIEQLEEKDFDEIISRAIKEANPDYPVPVIWKEDDFRILLNKLLKQ